ncbi:hypothetical protein HPB47_011425 [Ixodes persulcatus]|uniref:Uncharacterized protein n=1 Tax=Ixodes persulcatus TaxID=34615 RepID=A0AC60NWL5_IXOPE|nr:hypothetical protein HPB47_011425 [Ixodes persulcatus]
MGPFGTGRILEPEYDRSAAAYIRDLFTLAARRDKGVWKPRRKMMTPAFHFRTLEDYIPIMNRRAEEMVHDIAATIELEKTFFDVRPIVRRAAFAILFANILHWPDFIYNLTKENREFLANIKRVQTYNNQIVKQRKADYETGIGDEKLKKSFLDILLRLHIEEGILTEQEVRDEVSSIFIGGFDTTATAASFCLYLLGHHPEVQKKVHEEMDEVFGDDWERPVTLDDIKRLKYTECVLKVMRRYKVESKVPMEKLQLAFEIVLTAPEGLELKFTPRERPA